MLKALKAKTDKLKPWQWFCLLYLGGFIGVAILSQVMNLAILLFI
ncbi:hypothetical protein MSP8887_01036 [Marinomonas spartinae]|uniref:DUF2474 domain-containing protein n=1 Tax=Marinomonas spartinae TaxID=1792290 RepID=A0A1A8TUM5_9GAMM|nr:hypothetical protein [Marinomonas spartinae]SBS29276.1 hypothetical protein MSP8887_01036 [Marinomonas spartinae]SBS37648.1 hypothetical protein MSP8886_04211 [Marinomonas spartinae]